MWDSVATARGSLTTRPGLVNGINSGMKLHQCQKKIGSCGNQLAFRVEKNGPLRLQLRAEFSPRLDRCRIRSTDLQFTVG